MLCHLYIWQTLACIRAATGQGWKDVCPDKCVIGTHLAHDRGLHAAQQALQVGHSQRQLHRCMTHREYSSDTDRMRMYVQALSQGIRCRGWHIIRLPGGTLAQVAASPGDGGGRQAAHLGVRGRESAVQATVEQAEGAPWPGGASQIGKPPPGAPQLRQGAHQAWIVLLRPAEALGSVERSAAGGMHARADCSSAVQARSGQRAGAIDTWAGTAGLTGRSGQQPSTGNSDRHTRNTHAAWQPLVPVSMPSPACDDPGSRAREAAYRVLAQAWTAGGSP